jgi:hypothetical protein
LVNTDELHENLLPAAFSLPLSPSGQKSSLETFFPFWILQIRECCLVQQIFGASNGEDLNPVLTRNGQANTYKTFTFRALYYLVVNGMKTH